MVEDPSTSISGALSQLTDEDLVVKLQRDPRNRTLQGEIYDRFSERIYFKCLSIAKDNSTARDYAHDIFIKLFTKIHQFKGKSKFSLWVHSITYNYCIKQVQKKKIELYDYEEKEENSNIADSEIIFIDEDPEIQIKIITKCLEYLSPEEKVLISLKYWDDLKIEEIAEMMKLENSAVKMRLKRIRDKMKKHINKLSNSM